jgi:hypothetical protein
MRTYIQQPGQVGVQGGTIGNAGYLQEQERQRLLQEQQAQAELNNSMYGGGQYGQADQYVPAVQLQVLASRQNT